ncbi:hypothetical protein RCO48_15625 [Peribacillus frigoritolerans]|nr:hypothetical protein [Peribacillus frigoritolerans]
MIIYRQVKKKVAAYLIENLDEAAFKTAFQIGREAEVSETTVIRFSYSLGFEGFSKMQARIQKQLLHQNQIDLSNTDSFLRIDDKQDPFTKVIENESSYFKTSIRSYERSGYMESSRCLDPG